MIRTPRLSLRALALACVAAVASSSPACLVRDVSAGQPTTKLSFETVVPQPAIDKVDVLLMVDSSGSMADKQRILADAVPDLVKGLVQPKCVDRKTRQPTGKLADPLKPDGEMCDPGSEPAFAPITDMHIGVISSSLGGFGSGQCAEPSKNDEGHLLARGPGGKTVTQAGDLHFLAWYPDVQANRDKARHPDPPVPKTTSLEDLGSAFRDLVVGVGQGGCGLEAQLESIYRFLVQPDPWTKIDVAGNRASYGPAGDIDVELLRQRAAFLRPDSLVAVIVLTDEDDSSVDPLAFQGTGWTFETEAPMPRATSPCQADPASPQCTSCDLVRQCDPAKDAKCGALKGDPSCQTNGGVYTTSEDKVNVRFHRMKQRYGVDPQFPIARYVDALTKPRVPRRASEHDANGAYVAKADCTNPLFAKHLPSSTNDELCKLARGPRTEGLVYFAIIGGVPNQLLPDPSDARAKIDWTKIVGRDPSRWDETGIDAHMIQSTMPRAGLPPPGARDDADPVHGREWTTGGDDLQLACTFDLYERKADGTVAPVERACSDAERKLNLCDCDGKKDTPLCSPTDKNVQVKGKAYPTRRELLVARDLGDRAVVASLCPKQLTRPNEDDYGYRPAVRAITERLERTLFGSCLPRALDRDPDGSVACVVTAILPDPGPDSDCRKKHGLAPARPDLVRHLREKLVAEEGEAAGNLPICEVPQFLPPAGTTCKDEEKQIGFCYAENVPGASCSYGLLFTKPAARVVDARFSMQCIQLSSP
jgi:hypothetical protein